MQQHTARIIAALATATAAAALVGCAPQAKPTVSPTSPVASADANATSTPAATSDPTATTPSTPVTLTCDQVVTADQMYAYNPNFSIDSSYAPQSGSLAKQIADWKGVTCAWQNETSGDVIQIAVALPPTDQVEGLKNAAVTAAKPVPTYGTPPQVEGYFKAGETGQVQVFRGAYWIVAESAAFFEPGDAVQLVQSVLDNLPAS